MFRQCCVQHGWTIVGQCFVKLSNICTVLYPTVKWLVYAVSNCLMACKLSVQQLNGWTVLFLTVQWSDSPMSNFPKVTKVPQNYPKISPKVSQKYLKSIQKCPKSIPKVSPKYPKIISKVPLKYSKNIPKVS